MRAWQVTRYGAPADVLELVDAPAPEPGPEQVLVQVAATACNFPDVLMCTGEYQEKPPFPFTPGLEVAGTVLAAGDDARFAVGDKVIGQPALPRGGFAERTVLDAGAVHPWPEGMSAGQAAGMFITYQTGWCSLHHRTALQPGETLLVHAAAGGVGSAAVQLGKAAGATVIGTAGGADKCAVVSRLGADHVVDYRSEDLVARVKELTGGRGVDVVFDPVGGDVFDASRKVVAFEGRILVIGFAGGRIAQAPTNHALVKNYSVIGVHWGMYRARDPELVVAWQDALADLWSRGLIDPLVGEEHPLSAVPEALTRLASRATTGKVVVVP